jgi:hypothetical protein
VVEGGGLENRCTKVPWVRILLPPPHELDEIPGEMTELADGARLLSECGGKTPPRVRIPLSPPRTEKDPLLHEEWVFVFATFSGSAFSFRIPTKGSF